MVAGAVAAVLGGLYIDGQPAAESYAVDVNRIMLADYIDGMASSTLGASRACLFLWCLESDQAWR